MSAAHANVYVTFTNLIAALDVPSELTSIESGRVSWRFAYGDPNRDHLSDWLKANGDRLEVSHIGVGTAVYERDKVSGAYHVVSNVPRGSHRQWGTVFIVMDEQASVRSLTLGDVQALLASNPYGGTHGIENENGSSDDIRSDLLERDHGRNRLLSRFSRRHHALRRR